ALRQQVAGGVEERRDQLAFYAVRVVAAGDAESELLALLRRHIERPEHPVPEREAAAEILVEVLRILRVVHLMMRRADEDTAGEPAERDPHMRVLQVDVSVDEQHQDDAGIGERKLMRRGA